MVGVLLLLELAELEVEGERIRPMGEIDTDGVEEAEEVVEDAEDEVWRAREMRVALSMTVGGCVCVCVWIWVWSRIECSSRVV